MYVSLNCLSDTGYGTLLILATIQFIVGPVFFNNRWQGQCQYASHHVAKVNDKGETIRKRTGEYNIRVKHIYTRTHIHMYISGCCSIKHLFIQLHKQAIKTDIYMYLYNPCSCSNMTRKLLVTGTLYLITTDLDD